MNSKDIINKRFDKAAMFGYKVDEVDDFLEEVANEFQVLSQRVAELEKKMADSEEKLVGYREEEDSLRAALIGAQKLGDSVIRDAKIKAEGIIQEANIKASTIIESSKHQVDTEKYTLTTLQKEVAMFKNNLLGIYKQHLELISTLPEADVNAIVEDPQVSISQEEPEESVPETEEIQGEFTSEELEDEEQTVSANPAQSKFGPLKFGNGYDIAKDTVVTSKRKR